MLRDAAWCCVVLRGAAWCCVVLRGAARCCEVLEVQLAGVVDDDCVEVIVLCCVVLCNYQSLRTSLP